jgi:hypothetical protein
LPDQAMRTAESSVADARAINHPISLGQALAVAAYPIALWAGDLAAAEHYVEMLLDNTTRHALSRWDVYGRLILSLRAPDGRQDHAIPRSRRSLRCR